MTRSEITGERPTDYSRWHRKLPDYCKAQDVDWIEYRIIDDKPTPVALIETGRWKRTNFKGNQQKIAKYIAAQLNIPCYFVEYFIDEKNPKNNKFKVKLLNGNETEKMMGNKEYEDFIKNLKLETDVDNWM